MLELSSETHSKDKWHEISDAFAIREIKYNIYIKIIIYDYYYFYGYYVMDEFLTSSLSFGENDIFRRLAKLILSHASN